MNIRYPDGRVLRYRGSLMLAVKEGGGYQVTNKDGKLVACIPPGANVVVDWADPDDYTNIEDALVMVEAFVETESEADPHSAYSSVGWKGERALKNIKASLRSFDARSVTWR